MATVLKEVVQNSKAQDSSSGFSATRVFLVQGVTGTGHQRCYLALTTSGIPVRGEAHPSIPGVVVLDREAAPVDDSNQKYMVTVNYGVPDAASLPPNDGGTTETNALSIRVSGTSQNESTQLDKDGNQLTVTFTFPSDALDKEGNAHPLAGRTITQAAEVEIAVAQMVLEYSRRETQSPFTKAERHVGTINADSFYNLLPRTLLCTSIEGQSDDGGQSYLVTYTFQYRRETWQMQLAFIDPDTDKPAQGIAVSQSGTQGIVSANVYKETIFGLMGL